MTKKTSADLDKDIITAVWNSDYDAWAKLVGAGAHLCATQEPDKASLLHIAAYRGDFTMVRSLLMAFVNMQDKYGHTPLDMAAMNNRTDVIRELVAARASITGVGQVTTALHLAARCGCVDSVRTLVELGANINARDDYDSLPLHAAAVANYGDVIRLLVSMGADVNAVGPGGCTALHFAAMKGASDAINTLVELGADVNAKNDDGETVQDILNHCPASDNQQYMQFDYEIGRAPTAQTSRDKK